MRRVVTIVLLWAVPARAWVQDPQADPWQVPGPDGVPYCLAVNSTEANTAQLQDSFRAAVDAALHSWTAPCSGWCAHLSLCAGPPPPFGCDRVNWIEWLGNDYPLGPTSLAVTAVWAEGPNFTTRVDTDVLFNDRDYVWVIGDDPPNPDVESVAVHELGHSLGLAHYQPNADCTTACGNGVYPPAVMCTDYCGGLIRTPTSDDLDGLCTLYPSATVTPCAQTDGGNQGGDPTSTPRGCDCSAQPGNLLIVALLATLRPRRRSRLPHT